MIALRHLRFYHLLVYVPIEFEMVDNPYRPSDREYQAKVDLQLQQAIQAFASGRFIRLTGTAEQRAEQVISNLDTL